MRYFKEVKLLGVEFVIFFCKKLFYYMVICYMIIYGSDLVLVFINKLLVILKSGIVLLVWLLIIENIELWKN